MPRIMFKPNLDLDEYVIWSTVVDAPVSDVLNREDAKAVWREGACSLMGSPITDAQAEESMQRADTKGWSQIVGDCPEAEGVCLSNIDYPGTGGFGTFLVEGMAALTRAIGDEDWDTLDSLLIEKSVAE